MSTLVTEEAQQVKRIWRTFVRRDKVTEKLHLIVLIVMMLLALWAIPAQAQESMDAPDAADEQIVQVNDALEKLAALSPRLAQVVECRFFAGYTEEETGRALGVTDRTVRRDWLKAKAWLAVELDPA